MNRTILSLTLLSFLCFGELNLQAEQGYYLEEEVTTPPLFGLPGQKHITKTWLTSTRLRRDEGDKQQTLIIDTGDSQAWLVQHSDSTILPMDMSTFQGLGLMTLMMFGVTYDTLTGEPVIPDSIFYRTGRRMKVRNWICEEVMIQRRSPNPENQGKRPILMWVTADTAIDQPIYASILKKMMGPLVGQYASFFRQVEHLPGYPAEFYTRAMGMEITQKLILIDKREIPDSVFRLPAGYRKQTSNDF